MWYLVFSSARPSLGGIRHGHSLPGPSLSLCSGSVPSLCLPRPSIQPLFPFCVHIHSMSFEYILFLSSSRLYLSLRQSTCLFFLFVSDLSGPMHTLLVPKVLVILHFKMEYLSFREDLSYIVMTNKSTNCCIALWNVIRKGEKV